MKKLTIFICVLLLSSCSGIEICHTSAKFLDVKYQSNYNITVYGKHYYGYITDARSSMYAYIFTNDKKSVDVESFESCGFWTGDFFHGIKFFQKKCRREWDQAAENAKCWLIDNINKLEESFENNKNL